MEKSSATEHSITVVKSNEQIGNQLVAEVTSALDHFDRKMVLYEYKKSGAGICGITARGMREINNLLFNMKNTPFKIIIQQVDVQYNVELGEKKGVKAYAVAKNLCNEQLGYGICFEPYEKVGNNGPYLVESPDKTALGKARRNAVADIIPELILNKFIEKFTSETDGQQYNKADPGDGAHESDDGTITRNKVIHNWNDMIEKTTTTQEIYELQVKIQDKENNLLTDAERKRLVELARQRYFMLSQDEKRDGKVPYEPKTEITIS